MFNEPPPGGKLIEIAGLAHRVRHDDRQPQAGPARQAKNIVRVQYPGIFRNGTTFGVRLWNLFAKTRYLNNDGGRPRVQGGNEKRNAAREAVAPNRDAIGIDIRPLGKAVSASR